MQLRTNTKALTQYYAHLDTNLVRRKKYGAERLPGLCGVQAGLGGACEHAEAAAFLEIEAKEESETKRRKLPAARQREKFWLASL